MKQAKDILSNEAIEIAAQWWADSLKRPQKDNGDDSESGGFGQMLALFGAMTNIPSDEQLDRFKAALIAAIPYEYAYGDEVILRVDYHPEGALATAAQVAQISSMSFSWKTDMSISSKQIVVREGYGAPRKIIWQAES